MCPLPWVPCGLKKAVIIEVEELINQKRTPMPHHTWQMRHLRIGVLKHGVRFLMTGCPTFYSTAPDGPSGH